jgi:hypothetical protein
LGLPVSAIAREALLAARAYCPPQSVEDYLFQDRDPHLASLTDAQMRSVARELIIEPGALGQRNMLGRRDLRRALQRKFGRVGSTARRQRICQEETEGLLRGGKMARINQKKAAAPGAAFRPLTTLNGGAGSKAVERAKILGKKVIPHGAPPHLRDLAYWRLKRCTQGLTGRKSGFGGYKNPRTGMNSVQIFRRNSLIDIGGTAGHRI